MAEEGRANVRHPNLGLPERAIESGDIAIESNKPSTAKKTLTLRPAKPMPPPPPMKPPTVDFKSAGGDSEVLRVVAEVSGVKSLLANLAQLPRTARDAAGYEMSSFAHDVIAYAKEGAFVPFQYGNLESSGDFDDYVPEETDILKIACWFGSPIGAEGLSLGVVDTSKYALIQHEDLTFNHPLQGGPKYLENPFTEMVPELQPRIASAIARALGASQTDLGAMEDRLRSRPAYPGYGSGQGE